MDSLVHLANLRSESRSAEKQIIDLIIRDPSKVLSMSINELAERAEVSYATVCRLFRRAGFEGYKAFCKALEDDLTTQKNELYPPRITRSSATIDIISSYCTYYEDLLDNFRSAVNTTKIDRIAKMIISATSIYCIGQGFSSVSAEYASKKLLSLGYAGLHINDLDILSKSTLSFRKESIAILFLSDITDSVIAFSKDLHRCNVPIISISDCQSSPILATIGVEVLENNSSYNNNSDKTKYPFILPEILLFDIIFARMQNRIL